MAGSDALPSALLDPFRRDLAASFGAAAPDLSGTAAIVREFASSPADFVARVVDETQQYLHDSRTDITWPACPLHPHHPLWYRDGHWWCAQAGVAVAALGTLRAS